MSTIDPSNVLNADELDSLMARKRQVQAELAANKHSSQTPSQGGCGSGGCGGRPSGCGGSSASTAPALPAGEQPNVVKAVLIAVSILAVTALAWWAVIR